MDQRYQGNPYEGYAEPYPMQPLPQRYMSQAFDASRQQAQPYGRQAFGAHRQGYAAPQPVAPPPVSPRTRGGALKVAAGVLAGLVLGVLACFLLMRFVFSAASSGLQPVSPTLTEAQLSQVVGRYVFDGQVYDVTALEAITGTQALSASLNADGTYDAPSSDMVLAFARNQVLARLVADAGVTVGSDEVASYTYGLLGTYDMAVAASILNMDAEQAREALTAAAAVAKLKGVVCGSALSIAPPAYPADGQTEVGRPEYADYILGLVGTYWDWSLMTWANTNNPYYEVLKDAVFAQGSASYEAAQLAYGVAVQQAGGQGRDAAQIWTDYVNEYLDKAAVAIYTLRA